VLQQDASAAKAAKAAAARAAGADACAALQHKPGALATGKAQEKKQKRWN
jgi:hypothetical protein